MTHYSDLLKKYSNPSEIPYAELLNTFEWREKRDKIVKRDNCKCRLCGESATLYINGLGTIWLRGDHKKDFGWFKQGDNIAEKEINWTEYFHEEADRPYFLHVHHTYYILSNLPWEYPDDDLITYCNWCHLKVHQENIIEVFLDSRKTKKMGVKTCFRCKGTGCFQQYKHVENGVCFECRGQRFSLLNGNNQFLDEGKE